MAFGSTDVADNRSLREKLAAMAASTASGTENEARIAAGLLAKLAPVPAAGTKSPGVLTRERIFAAPDAETSTRYVRVRIGGSWATLTEEEAKLFGYLSRSGQSGTP